MKLFAFKTQAFNPDKPLGVPDEWQWLKQQIDESEKEQYESDNWIVLDSDDFKTYMINKNVDTNLRVFALVNDQFKLLHPSKIDFRRHLQADKYLQKTVTLLPNGRPEVATYTLNGEKIAQIRFAFEVDGLNFMTRRTEYLAYFKENDTLSEEYPIADDYYNKADPYHLQLIMKERSEARGMIIEQLKAFLNGVLAQYYTPQGWTYSQILAVVGDFWNEYGQDINAWISVAGPRFADKIAAETNFAFLDVMVSPTMNMKQYIQEKISY